MRLDHVSYVASHEQISDVVNRIGSQIGTAFVDGGIHPKFGTRNFTAPLLNGQYIEIVCALDHPATETTPFGRAVKKKSEEGGGWLTWVFNTNSLKEIEKRIGRNFVEGNRRKPDGTNLLWKQLGVLATLEKSELPFFVEWISKEHPSLDGKPTASISKITLFGDTKILSDWINGDVKNHLGNIELIIEPINHSESKYGINSIEFNVNSKKTVLIV